MRASRNALGKESMDDARDERSYSYRHYIAELNPMGPETL